MAIKQQISKFSEIINKYKYAFLILLIGLILMIGPTLSGNENEDENEITKYELSKTEMFEEKLSVLLSKVEGAGDVDVMLTVAAGEEVIYQTNDDRIDSNASTDVHMNTVTITDSERNQTGLIRQVYPEVYQGAIVVCRGADSPSVRLAIVDAVSRITGLGANAISVLKMK
jgi:stage III sporulation protein AG